mmetsp:Transcript_44317/g.43011  ORF Transcript_44317/g.43011 Transcript_44317/m.43011 type:complete len:100 (+) Transcript_44317:696-995(+)
MKEALYLLFREVIIVLTCVIILEGVYYYEILSFEYFHDDDGYMVIIGDQSDFFPFINVGGTTYCILLMLGFYTVLGFIFCILAQKQVEKWTEMEKLAND